MLVVPTVRRFKGLEVLATIIVVNAGLTANEELTYVPLWRARTHSYLVGPPWHLEAFNCAPA